MGVVRRVVRGVVRGEVRGAGVSLFNSPTESIVVFLQSRSSIYILTDSLFSFCVYSHSLAFVFSEPFPNVFRDVH